MPSTPKTTKTAITAARGSKQPVMGRPSICTPQTTEEICRRIMDGQSLRSICQDEALPHIDTVRRWLFDAAGSAPKPEHADFFAQYAQARAVAMEDAGDQARELADAVEPDRDAVAKAKLQVDVIRWQAEKMAPKRYGAKVTAEHTGKDGGPIETKQTVDVSKLSVETLRKIKEELAK